MADETTRRLRAYYDDEAVRYDASRGGQQRATRAAAAFAELLGPPSGLPGPVAEVGAGTAAVSQALRRKGFAVASLDISIGMLKVARGRGGGSEVQCDGRHLPLADASCGAVVLSWLLHLVDDPAPFLAEAARALRPGGLLVSTVDKRAAHGQLEGGERASDAPERLDLLGKALGLRPGAVTSYEAVGQPGTPVYRLRSWTSEQ